jgi:hypothetical protein
VVVVFCVVSSLMCFGRGTFGWQQLGLLWSCE